MAIVGDPRMFVYVAVLAVGLASGAMSQYFYPGNPLSPVHAGAAVVASALIFVWYRFDTDRRRYRRSPFLNIAIVCISLLALPYYFFRSRGFRRGLAAVWGLHHFDSAIWRARDGRSLCALLWPAELTTGCSAP